MLAKAAAFDLLRNTVWRCYWQMRRCWCLASAAVPGFAGGGPRFATAAVLVAALKPEVWFALTLATSHSLELETRLWALLGDGSAFCF